MNEFVGFTIQWAPLIVTAMSIGSSFGFYFIFVHLNPRSVRFWLTVDTLWVASSVIAFFLVSLSFSMAPHTDRVTEIYKDLNSQFDAVIDARSGFHFNHCSPHMGDNVDTWELDRTQENRDICNKFSINSLQHAKVNDALFGLTIDRPAIPYTGSTTVFQESASSIARDWNKIELAVMRFDGTVETFNRARKPAIAARRVEYFRTIWFYIFPLIAGLRINRSFAEARRRAERDKRSEDTTELIPVA